MSTKNKVIKPVVKKVTAKPLTKKKVPTKLSKPAKKVAVLRKPAAKFTAKPAAKSVKKPVAKVSVTKKNVAKKTTPKTVPVKKKVSTKATKPAPKTSIKKVTAKPVLKKAPPKTPVKIAPPPVKLVKVIPKTAPKTPTKVPTKPVSKPIKAAPVKTLAKKQVPVKLIEAKKIPPTPPLKVNSNIPKRAVNDGGKRRLIVSYKNLTQEQLDIWREKYPRGYSDYMSDIMRFGKPDGSFFYYVILDMEDTTLLVKVDVKVDSDYEEVEKEIFGGGPDNANNDNDEFPDTGDENSEFSDEVEAEDEE